MAPKLTSSLLAFARKQPLRPRSTDVEALIATTSDLLTSVLGRQIEIDFVKRGYIGTVFVDPDQLSSALVNLGINARDAMPNGGRLTIDADTVAIDQDEAAVRDLSAGSYVTISVTDTGTGIDKAIQNKIYEPFFSTKGVGKGTGLGLSMVYGFVKQSGGHIDFETVEGKGTTFRLYLPASEHASFRLLPIFFENGFLAATRRFSVSRTTRSFVISLRSNSRHWDTGQSPQATRRKH